MPRHRSVAAATLFVAASTLLALIGAATPAGAAGPTAVYDSIPTPLAPNYPSQPFQAQATREFGDDVTLGTGGRALQDITFGVSTWARQADVPTYTDPSAWTDPTGWSHPFTVTVYAVGGPVTAPVVGAVLAQKTETKKIAWRHPDTTGCGPGRWSPINDSDTSSCFSGQALELTFDLSSQAVVLPARIAVTLGFDTQTWGANPTGASGPYDSFNVALPSPAPTKGTDSSADTVLWDSTYQGRPAGLTSDAGWTDYVPALRVTTSGASESTTVVTAANAHGWTYFDDQGAGGTLGSYVAGPATPPLGHGSARLVVSAANQGQALILVPNSGGTRLDAISELAYSTYRSSADAGNNLAIALQFNLDFDLTDANDTWQGRLIYEPYQANGGAVVQGSWQTWDALAGTWWVSRPSSVSPAPSCVQATPCTMAQFLAAYPNAGVHKDALGGFVLKAGSGWASFDGNVDALRIGINGVTTQYDFEDTPQCTTDCYVSPSGSDLNGGTSFADATKTIGAALQRVVPSGTVHLSDATYAEDVLIDKAGVKLLGVGLPTIEGVPGGDTATVRVGASNVVIDGVEITRQGNTLATWNDPLNTAGIAIQSQAITGTQIKGVTLTGNRTAIDINDSSGHSVLDSTITGNHTGMVLRNRTDDLSVLRNRITDNRTVGVLFLDASGGSNSPVQQAHGSAFHWNDISGNWYGDVVDRQSGGSLPAVDTTNRKDFSNNWWGTTTPAITDAASGEPGYAVHIPVSYGGTAVAPVPAKPEIAGSASANIDFTPILVAVADAGPGAGVTPLHVKVHHDGAQLGTEGRIQEGIDTTVAHGIVDVAPAALPYSETATDRAIPGSTGYTFGLYFPATKPGVHVRGVTASDVVVADPGAIGAVVTTNATNDFGYSGTFVYGSDVTLQGLEFGTNNPSSGKTFEVIGDGFSLLDSFVNDTLGTVYFDDWAYDSGTDTSSIASFTIDGNRFAPDNQITVASGTGYGHPESGRLITNNTFDSATTGLFISFRGAAGPGGVPWYVLPVGGATISGNTFGPADTAIRATDTYAESQFDWTSWREDNTFARLVWVEDGASAGELRSFSYTSGGYAFANARQLGGRIDSGDAARPAGVDIAQAGDTVHVHSGTYPEQAIVDKADITIQGYGLTRPLVDDGGSATGNGILITGDDVTLANVKVQGYGTGVRLGGGVDSLLDGVSVLDVESVDNAGHGLFASAISGLSHLTIDGGGFSRNSNVGSGAGRGISIFDGPKSDITITDVVANDNALVGIDVNDGNVTGLTITGNTVQGNTDSGIGVTGAKGPSANLVAGNTVTDNGRFGIEIKNPTGSGAPSGPGSVVVSGNTVSRSAAANRTQDLAGIAVFRRGVTSLNADQPSGVYVVGNTVDDYQNSGVGDGFGIVVEGTGHTVTQNIVSGNDVGVQAQAGNPSNPSGDASDTGTAWFDRGNAASYSGTVPGNSISGNSTGFRAVGLAGAADASGNWWGSTDQSVVAAQIAGGVDFTPFLHTGADTSAAHGFQGDLSSLDVVRVGAQVGAGPRIQEAIDMVTGSTVYVHAGSYIEDVEADVADLHLLGAHHGDPVGPRTFDAADEATIHGQVTIQAQDVVFDGFSLANSTASDSVIGILVKTAGDDATIVNDIMHGVTTSNGAGIAQAIYLEHGPDGVTIGDNAISGVSSQRSAKGIYIGDTSASDPSAGVSITGNTISDIESMTKGAYGIQTNNAAGATLTITGNVISGLNGSWAHGIGIEGNAPGLAIDHNVIHDLAAAGIDKVAVFFEDDASYAHAEVHHNDLDVGANAFGAAIHPSLAVSTDIDATCNWWGDANGPGAVAAGTESLVGPDIDHAPWLVSADPDGACDSIVETVAPVAHLTFDEGTAQVNDGAFDNTTAAITPGVGAIGTFTDHHDGTWSWSLSATDVANDGPASGTITVSATTALGATATTSFTYDITNVAPSGTFVAPAEVAVGDDFVIQFGSTVDPSAGDTAFTYTLTCGAASPVTGSSASTTCAAPTSAQVGSLIHVTGTIAEDDGATSVAYQDDVLVVPALTITPATHSFGSVVVGQASAPVTFTLTNHSDVDYDIDEVGFFVTATNHFRIVDGPTDHCSGQALAAHTSCTFEVVFTPQATGPRTTTLGVQLDGAQAPLPKPGSQLSGIGIAPHTTISAASHTYPDTTVGQTSSATFTVGNDGSADLHLGSIAISGSSRFARTGGSCSLPAAVAPGASCTIEVSFAPTAPGALSGDLVVTTDGGTLTTHLDGTGVAVPMPALTITPSDDPFDFGDVAVGATDSQQFAIANTGEDGSVLHISSITITYPDSGFSRVGGTVPVDLEVGDDPVLFSVAFAPDGPGLHRATMSISATGLGATSIQLKGTGIAPELSISPSSHNFGDVTLDHTKSKLFTVANTGTAALSGLVVTVSGDDLSILVDESDCDETTSLVAGEDCTVRVRYQPDELGDDSGTLTATADGGLSDTSSLEGSGVAGEPIVTVDPDQHEFDDVVVGGAPDTQAFTIENEGDAALTGMTVQVIGAPAFAIVAADSDCDDITSLAPGASCVVTIQFSPGAAGDRSATLRIQSSNASTVSVPLSGRALAPELSISPSSHNFGDVTLDHTKSKLFTVANTGTAALSGLVVTVSGDDLSILVDESDCDETTSLVAGEDCTVRVRYQPDELGDDSGTLTATADGGVSDTSSLEGSGVVAKGVVSVTPDEAAFGSMEVGTAASIRLTVTNTGDADLTFSAVTLTGAPAFSIAPTSGADCRTEVTSLAPDSTCVIGVGFAPGSVGDKSAALKVLSDAANGTVNVPLAGRGTPHPSAVSVTPDPYDFGRVVYRGVETKLFTVTNRGGTPVSITGISRTGSSTFAVLAADNGCAGETLGENESCSFRVRFVAPSDTAGAKNAVLHVVGTGFDPILVPVTATAEPFRARVDAFITDKTDRPRNYVGRGIYCTTSCPQQQVSDTIRRGTTVTYRVRIKNDGNGVDDLRVRLTQAASKASVRRIRVLRNGNQDVTSQVANGSYVAKDVNPGAEIYFWVRVTLASDAVPGRVNAVIISGQSTRTPSVKDNVRALTRVR